MLGARVALCGLCEVALPTGATGGGTLASSAFLSACPDVGQKLGGVRWDLNAVSRQTSKVDLDSL